MKRFEELGILAWADDDRINVIMEYEDDFTALAWRIADRECPAFLRKGLGLR